MTPGIHRGLSMSAYQSIDAIGSGRLNWLATSPLHYRYMLSQPPEDTEATLRGTAVHTAVLEPEHFETIYACEPNPEAIAPGAVKPRATSLYRDAVARLREEGKVVFKTDEMQGVLEMAVAVRGHSEAARILKKGEQREVSLVWERDGGRLCRARVDILGDRMAADLKTTRDLRRFSPWEMLKHGYFRQASWYVDGLRTLGIEIDHWFFIAVESVPPYDVGVFTLTRSQLDLGSLDCERLIEQLEECERTDCWPGMFPKIVAAEMPESMIGEIEAAMEVA